MVSGIGVAILIVGVVVSAPAARIPGPVLVEWWPILSLAALVTLIGFGLGFWLATPGGVVLALGAVTALGAVFFGASAKPD